ncbi:hypothetical protein K490DRAFT_31322 [Saccharata proteae CBS 121410]|uniref:Uncharacterized protein n=1 Tax=Saccharata proteae CBS 121410 TaxID=1314787 RepID=A0A9P4I289_9PEZI|nr:hypothetical protein K490DRAFT_31322 [Saccharata proteae CBS 121410]
MSSTTLTPKSAHLSDPSLLPFLQPDFDPAEHLNSLLPSLSLDPRRSKSNGAVSLSDLSARTQTLLSQLNAQTTRLSAVLTQMTDDILRCGGRLAYEVDVLRGETVGLSEALTEGLAEDIVKYVPGGLKIAEKVSAAEENGERRASTATSTRDAADTPAESAQPKEGLTLPPHIEQLRMLTLVRSRLESVIQVFGEAMQWTLPPSELSLASSLISVSAPEPGSESHSREEKGREFAEKLRNDISELVTGSDEGFEAAQTRIQALRDLAQVWKGTAEEKARIRFVDGLVKLAEDRQRAQSSQRQRKTPVPQAQRQSDTRSQTSSRGNGFLDNLQRMRENYLD